MANSVEEYDEASGEEHLIKNEYNQKKNITNLSLSVSVTSYSSSSSQTSLFIFHLLYSIIYIWILLQSHSFFFLSFISFLHSSFALSFTSPSTHFRPPELFTSSSLPSFPFHLPTSRFISASLTSLCSLLPTVWVPNPQTHYCRCSSATPSPSALHRHVLLLLPDG